MMNKAIPIACALSTCVMGCAKNDAVKDKTAQDVAVLQAFVGADLAHALDLARQGGDVVAASCYEGLLKAQSDLPKPSTSHSSTGAVTAYQGARNIRRSFTVETDKSASLKLACGGLIVDEEQFLMQLASKLGIKISTMGTAP